MAQHTEALGPAHEVTVGGTRIRYHDTGSGPPMVFVHGVFANADLWHELVPQLSAAGYRCLAPDWPLGSQEIPALGQDLAPSAVADLIAGFLAELDLEDVTVVGNDTGGALTQLLFTRHPERIGRVVLTSADCYEQFFPGSLKLLTLFARIPGSMRVLTELLRFSALHPLAYGMLSKRGVPLDVRESFLAPARNNAAVRRDLRRFNAGVHRRYTLAAASEFPRFTKPVLLAWSGADRFFPSSLAHRLAGDLPNASLRFIADSYTFSPIDQPQRLAELILEFAGQHAPS
ncbi:alpha/beta fold hydrolase [Sciscionella sediminilitoris]|uniref:alpha/beta fold hydrolase n=1 Tax=Sciscionella sediminilitoris TaxID=1445613 RepID=UPI0004DEF009|nr:alpha/beta hydrolase [Sciscionella sp. SE31]